MILSFCIVTTSTSASVLFATCACSYVWLNEHKLKKYQAGKIQHYFSHSYTVLCIGIKWQPNSHYQDFCKYISVKVGSTG